MKKRKYLLTIKYVFEASDDLSVRIIANTYWNNGDILLPIMSNEEKEMIKLQNIYDNKEPRKVEL